MSDVSFQEIRFKNFMSFGNLWTVVPLSKPGTVHVVGENLDEGGSSGAGKSTLISAIAYCLYDQIPSKVSKDKLLNRTNDKKSTSMEVQLTFHKGTDVFVVRRYRGEQTGVQLLMNGNDITPANLNRGEDNFNAKIEQLVGFSYSLFSQIILFNGNSRPFLDLSVGDQRNLIEELFNITTLTKKANSLKKRVVETDKQISMLKLLNKEHENRNDRHRLQVKEADDRIIRWNDARDKQLVDLHQQIENFKLINFDDEAQVHALIAAEVVRETAIKSQIALIQSQKGAKESQKSAKEREQNPKGKDLYILTSERDKLAKELATSLKELEHLREAKCPYCLQQFVDAQAKIAELDGKVAQLKVDIADNQANAAETQKLADAWDDRRKIEVAEFAVEIEEFVASLKIATGEGLAITAQINEWRSALSHKSLTELNSVRNGVTTLESRLEQLAADVNPHIEAADKLKAEGEIVVAYAAVDEMQLLQDHQSFLVKLLIDKNSFIRKNIISKTIPFLNKRIGYYTEKLNLPHIVLFQPDMSCQITQYARELDHGNLSNGEKKKLNLSLCLAFRDVLTYLHAKVNLLLTDEVDGGSISGNDVDSLIGLLKRKAWDDEIGIMIISHRPEFEGRCDRNLVVRKEAGFSSLILQPET